MRQEIVGIGNRTCPFCRESNLSVFVERTYLKSGKVKKAMMKTERCRNYPCMAGGYEDKITPEQAENIIQTALKK